MAIVYEKRLRRKNDRKAGIVRAESFAETHRIAEKFRLGSTSEDHLIQTPVQNRSS